MVCSLAVCTVMPPAWKSRQNEIEKNEESDDAAQRGSVSRSSTTAVLSGGDSKTDNNKNSQSFKICGFSITQIVVSITSDVDLVADWFYWDWVRRNGARVPDVVELIVTVFVGIATALWVLMITEARIPIFRCLGLPRITNRFILWSQVFLEDVPQVVLTGLIELDYLGRINPEGVWNIATSLHSIMTKVRALLDNDVMENYMVDEDEDGGAEDTMFILERAEQAAARTQVKTITTPTSASEDLEVENAEGQKMPASEPKKTSKTTFQTTKFVEGSELPNTNSLDGIYYDDPDEEEILV